MPDAVCWCHAVGRNTCFVCTSDMLEEELDRVVKARCCVLKHILGVYIWYVRGIVR